MLGYSAHIYGVGRGVVCAQRVHCEIGLASSGYGDGNLPPGKKEH